MGAWSHEPFGNDTANDWAYAPVELRDYAFTSRVLNWK